ncbi:MAG: hypothetical protein IJ466_07620 [Clostridia bacterium]|nr:hypothetical protein [Clostridia bacterium]
MHFAILTILAFALQNLCCKEYGRRFPGTLRAQAAMTFVATAIVTAIMACLGGAQAISGAGVAIVIAFGAFFVLTLMSMTIAMNSGHMGITLLIQNSSLVVPTIYGIIAWNERMTLPKGVGFACILFMMALSSGDTGAPSEADKRSWNKKRWVLFTALAFIGDSFLSILQGMMSRASASTDSVTFTFWTSLVSMVISLALLVYFSLRSREGKLVSSRKEALHFAWTCAGIGVGTAGGNCFTILSLTLLPGVVFFPLRQGALVLVMWLLGILLYKEKVNRRGLIMLASGLVGLILLNL